MSYHDYNINIVQSCRERTHVIKRVNFICFTNVSKRLSRFKTLFLKNKAFSKDFNYRILEWGSGVTPHLHFEV